MKMLQSPSELSQIVNMSDSSIMFVVFYVRFVVKDQLSKHFRFFSGGGGISPNARELPSAASSGFMF